MYTRTHHIEDAEIRQLESRIALASGEAIELRKEIAKLERHIKLLDDKAQLRSHFAKTQAQHAQAVASWKEHKEDIKLLEKELSHPHASGSDCCTIDAPTDFVHALAFSKDGRYLASASNDRVVCVYDVKHEFTTIWELQGSHPFTALAWRDGGLFMGNMDGDVTLSHPTTKSKLNDFELVYKANEPIHVMEFNLRGDHLLVCSGADVMLLKKSKSGIWQYQDRLPRPIPLGETEDKLPPIVATGAYFLESRNECLIAYLHDGFRIFKIDTWENIRICGSDEKLYEKMYIVRRAASAISPDSTFIIATNLHKGLDWYKIMPDKLKKMSTSCEIQSPGSNIPLPVLFINNGQATIMGMSKGYAVIFEAKHGKRVQALKHGGDQTWVTALAYAEPENGCRMIATGDGNCSERTRILIWTEISKDSSSHVSKLRFVLFKIVHMVTNAGYIIFLLMAMVVAMSLLFPTPWTEMDPGRLLEYLAKLSVPATPPPPPTPVEILISLGDLLSVQHTKNSSDLSL
ncbi:WD40-repeat-containing domain protein [Lentinula novae-zelandiae]|nr:WD40-repeat-containing domain protein [Lentinula novae-zelandiae]